MDLLHSRRCDGFCLVSSDSDFMRLAARIREEGVQVFGFGEQKTPESFRQACHRFIYTENLGSEAPAGNASSAVKPLLRPSSATPIITKVIAQMDSEDGWVDLSTFGRRLRSISPDFDERTYGFKKLSDLVRNIGAFEVDQIEGGGLRMRLRPARPKKATRQAKRQHP
jgi:uncharacterized LabA/DUF88 family protein